MANNNKKRVAAYARVSTEKSRALDSLSAQVSYYSEYIQRRVEWKYARVYVDSGESGGKYNRAEFQRLLNDCRAGKIDIILTKSISRFARDVVHLLETTRELKSIGVEVRFDKENLSTFSPDGELMLALLGSFAEEERRNHAENIKWCHRRLFEKGRTTSKAIYGYKYNGDECEIEPTQGAVVLRIYTEYLGGLTANQIAHGLNADGVKTYHGKQFCGVTIANILKNVRYTGCLLLQKTFKVNGKKVKNHGELRKYYVEDSHIAIIDKVMFEAVQIEMAKRKKVNNKKDWSDERENN